MVVYRLTIARKRAIIFVELVTNQIEIRKRMIYLKTWKLVSGILSIVLFVFVAFQSCAAGVYNSLSENAEISGTAGIIVAFLMMASGIVSISTRKGGRGGSIAVFVLYGLSALIGFANAGSFADLNIWAGWCAICAVIALFGIFKSPKAEQ